MRGQKTNPQRAKVDETAFADQLRPSPNVIGYTEQSSTSRDSTAVLYYAAIASVLFPTLHAIPSPELVQSSCSFLFLASQSAYDPS